MYVKLLKEKQMKKGLKIAAIVVGVIIILMLLLPFAFQGKIAGIVKTEGNKMLNAQFDFKKLNISLFRNFPQASVTLEDFWLKGTGEFANDTLVQAGEVTATINLFSLFGDSGYDISKVFIEDTRLHAIVLPDGHVNWDIMKPDTTDTQETPATEEESSPFKVKLQRFVIKNMNLIYDDQQGKMYADIRDFNALCAGDLGSDRTTLKLEAETKSLTYKMNGIPFLANANISANMDVDADLANNKYTLKDNTIRLNAIQAGIDGWVELKDPAIDMDLKLNTNDVGFKEILSLIPAIYATEFSSLKTDGTATLAASAKGTLQGDTVPAFNIDMQVKNAMFRYPALPAGVDQININANVRNPGGNIDLTTIQINPFSFRLAGNPFSLTADVKTPVSDPDFKAEAKGTLDLGMIKQVYPLGDMELNGTINADMQMSGRLSYIEKEQYDNMKASGTIGLTNMKLKMQDMPDVDIKKSLFTFTPKYLQLSETTVNIGMNPWKFSGDKKLRYWNVMPEYRWYTCQKFGGHFFGIHALGGEYNVKNVDLPFGILPKTEKGRHYEGWYVGGGLTYGYQWLLSEHLNLEGSIGLGYIYSPYKLYGRCDKCLDKDHRNYVGPTKAALSLIYAF